MKTIIIAEAGINHNGSIKIAKKLIDCSKKAGADFVKFQLYNTKELVTKESKLANYQKKNTKNLSNKQFNLLKNNELKFNDFLILKEYAKNKKIKILFSVFDLESLKTLKKIRFTYVKIPSGEITNYILLKEIGKLRKKVLLSSGISTLREIKEAINILINNGTNKKNITVLHCNSEYPSPITDINMKVLSTISSKLNVNIGYSDHSKSWEVPIIAVALGAKFIEKHITLNKKLNGPDHSSSLDPKEFKIMTTAIRNTETILGDKIKKPSKSEIKNKNIVRKSIVASKKINKGEIFTLNNVTFKRPGNGMSPMKINKVLGKKAKKKYEYNEKIKL